MDSTSDVGALCFAFAKAEVLKSEKTQTIAKVHPKKKPARRRRSQAAWVLEIGELTAAVPIKIPSLRTLWCRAKIS